MLPMHIQNVLDKILEHTDLNALPKFSTASLTRIYFYSVSWFWMVKKWALLIVWSALTLLKCNSMPYKVQVSVISMQRCFDTSWFSGDVNSFIYLA